MRRLMAVSLGILLALPLAAAAGEISGKVKEVDKAAGAIVLEDGTRLSVGEAYFVDLSEGTLVVVTYEEQNGQKIASEIDLRADAAAYAERPTGGGTTSNFGSRAKPAE